jgi:hypothetical protein
MTVVAFRMSRSPLLVLLGFVSLGACAQPSGALSGASSAQEERCVGEREAARIEAGFSLQATATEYAGSDEAALAQDMQDASVANEMATAAFERCMAG